MPLLIKGYFDTLTLNLSDRHAHHSSLITAACSVTVVILERRSLYAPFQARYLLQVRYLLSQSVRTKDNKICRFWHSVEQGRSATGGAQSSLNEQGNPHKKDAHHSRLEYDLAK